MQKLFAPVLLGHSCLATTSLVVSGIAPFRNEGSIVRRCVGMPFKTPDGR